MLTAGVAVDKATLDFDRIFTYSVPQRFENEIKTGSIVLVPFGRGNTLRIGIVLSIGQIDDVKGIKPIKDLKNDDNVITNYAMSLVKHLKETTFCTWYEAVRTVIPYGALYKIQNGMLSKQLVRYTKSVFTRAEYDESTLKTEKQRDVYRLLKTGTYDADEITALTGTTKAVLNTLTAKGAVSVRIVDRHSSAYVNIRQCRDHLELSEQQQKAYDEIVKCTDSKPHLLHGVTSSGKSMVFIKLIMNALEKGESAMVLVPEISLTPQMVRLVKEYFGDTVSIIHSRLSATERLIQYNRALRGETRVVVGTRSAIFTPLSNLGIIIIDEEHERTYKSESSPRYNAIRVAQYIQKISKTTLVLSSATPSVESYYLAKQNYYHLHEMPDRYSGLPLPDVEIIDMSQQAAVGDTGPVSDVILKYIADSVANEKQCIVLINRRGYSTVGICKECKQPLKCKACSVNLVRHKKQNKLMCHYCGRIYPVTDTCPECGGEISYSGFGTQKIEEYIEQAIPSARILRMDADSTRHIDAHEEMLEAFRKKEYNIMIGTQMVAKGLDFEDVNLVCVLGIDAMLNQPGYNSNEQAFNLITQVIGRAGRRNEGAKAVIQTYDRFNPVIELASSQNYRKYFENEIAYRKLNVYPPFCTMVTVAFSHSDERTCEQDANEFLEIIKRQSEREVKKTPLTVLGPVPFDIAMVNNSYRYRLTVKCINNPQFRAFLNSAIDIYLKDKGRKSSVYVNINSSTD